MLDDEGVVVCWPSLHLRVDVTGTGVESASLPDSVDTEISMVKTVVKKTETVRRRL